VAGFRGTRKIRDLPIALMASRNGSDPPDFIVQAPDGGRQGEGGGIPGIPCHDPYDCLTGCC